MTDDTDTTDELRITNAVAVQEDGFNHLRVVFTGADTGDNPDLPDLPWRPYLDQAELRLVVEPPADDPLLIPQTLEASTQEISGAASFAITPAFARRCPRDATARVEIATGEGQRATTNVTEAWQPLFDAAIREYLARAQRE